MVVNDKLYENFYKIKLIPLGIPFNSEWLDKRVLSEDGKRLLLVGLLEPL